MAKTKKSRVQWDYDEVLDTMRKQGIIDDELEAKLNEVFADEGVKQFFANQSMMHSTYASRTTELESEREALDRDRANAQAYFNDLKGWSEQHQAVLQIADRVGGPERLAQLVSSYNPDPNNPNRSVNSQGDVVNTQVIQELQSRIAEMEKQSNQRIEQVRQSMANDTLALVDLRDDYQEKFGKTLSNRKFNQFMAEKAEEGVRFADLNQAYQSYIEPEIKTKQEKERKDWEANTRKEIEKQVRSQAGISLNNPNSEHTSFFKNRIRVGTPPNSTEAPTQTPTPVPIKQVNRPAPVTQDKSEFEKRQEGAARIGGILRDITAKDKETGAY